MSKSEDSNPILSFLSKVLEVENIPFGIAVLLLGTLMVGYACSTPSDGTARLVIAGALLFGALGVLFHWVPSIGSAGRIARVASVKKGYKKINKRLEELKEAPVSIYIHDFEKVVASSDKKYVQIFLQTVTRHIWQAHRDGLLRAPEIIKVYIFYAIHDENDKELAELESEFLKVLVDQYFEYATNLERNKDSDRKEVLKIIKSHVQASYEAVANNAETVILVGKDNASLFVKLNKRKSMLINLEDHVLSQVFSGGFINVVDEFYFNYNNALVQSHVEEIIRDNYFADDLYHPDVLSYFQEKGQKYKILSLHGYCMFGYEVEDTDGKMKTIGEILWDRKKKGVDIELDAHFIEEGDKLKDWIYKNDYPPLDYKTNQGATEEFCASHGDKDFIYKTYRYLPECRIIIIDDEVMLISFYHDYRSEIAKKADPDSSYHFDFLGKAFRFPVYKLELSDENDEDLFNELKLYYDNITAS